MNRRILVTGARRGIGAEPAAGLAAPGTTVLSHPLGAAAEASSVARRCRDAGASAVLLDADPADPLMWTSLGCVWRSPSPLPDRRRDAGHGRGAADRLRRLERGHALLPGL